MSAKTSLSLGYLDGRKTVGSQQQLDKTAFSAATGGKRVIDQVVEFVCYCTKAASEEVQLKVCKVRLAYLGPCGDIHRYRARHRQRVAAPHIHFALFHNGE